MASLVFFGLGLIAGYLINMPTGHDSKRKMFMIDPDEAHKHIVYALYCMTYTICVRVSEMENPTTDNVKASLLAINASLKQIECEAGTHD